MRKVGSWLQEHPRVDVNVYIAYNVYMKNIQYTIRNIPPAVDQVIRKRSIQSGKSFNQTVVELLSLQTFGSTDPQVSSSFEWLYGKNTLDTAFDDAIESVSKTDDELWK